MNISNSQSSLGIIPCSKSKIWDELPNIRCVLAENVYTNPFHSLARSYISLLTKDWMILSAKYGLLWPTEVIEETYDVTFDRTDDPYISIEDIKKQIKNKKISGFQRIILVANSRYVSVVERVFEGTNVQIEVPFKDIEDDEQGSHILNQVIGKMIGGKC